MDFELTCLPSPLGRGWTGAGAFISRAGTGEGLRALFIRKHQPATRIKMDEDNKPPDLTRRQWLLRLGEATVLAGFSGIASEAPLVIAAQPKSAEASQALPPGLYAPSPEHMTHALFRDEPYVTPPPGCETEYVRPLLGPFQPAFFSEDEFPVVRRLVALLLNAPDAAAAKTNLKPASAETINEIAQWIDLVVSEAAAVREAVKKLSPQHFALAVSYYGAEAVHQLETDDPQSGWRQGLAWLKDESAKHGAAGFLNLPEAQQLELLHSIGNAQPKTGQGSADSRLYHLLRNQTIEGYYTSQAGLKELDYKGNAFYAESPGCQ
jgi:Gluconate 2-dehydrogenase subunit 3